MPSIWMEYQKKGEWNWLARTSENKRAKNVILFYEALGLIIFQVIFNLHYWVPDNKVTCMFKMCVLKKEPCLVKYDNLSIVLLSRSVFSRGLLWSLKYDFLQHNKKTSDDPVYWVIKTNFKKEKQTFYIYFSFPKSIKIILDLFFRNTNEIQVMMASHMNE